MYKWKGKEYYGKPFILCAIHVLQYIIHTICPQTGDNGLAKTRKPNYKSKYIYKYNPAYRITYKIFPLTLLFSNSNYMAYTKRTYIMYLLFIIMIER